MITTSNPAKVNHKNAPTFSLIVTAILTNLFLLSFLFTDYAYGVAYSLCTAAILISYLLVGIYQIQYSYQHSEYGQLLIGIIAAGFQLMGITLAGLNYVLLCSVAYLPGFCFYILSCKERNHQLSMKEKIIIGVISLAAIFSIVLLFTGKISV